MVRSRHEGGGEWTREPPDRTAAMAAPSRLRRRAPAIAGSTDRSRARPVGNERGSNAERGWHRGRSRPFVPGGRRSFRFRQVRHPEAARDAAPTPAQPRPRPAASRPRPTRSVLRAPRAKPTSRRPSAPSSRSTTAVPPTCSSRSRAANASAATRSWASARAACSRCATASRAPSRGRSSVDAYAPDLPVDGGARARPSAALRALRATPARGAARRHAALHRRRRGRAGVRRDLRLRATCRSRTPIPSPPRSAAFMETDLVLVFDHLTHTLSAIASLHTEAPDFEGATGSPSEPCSKPWRGRHARPRAADVARGRPAGDAVRSPSASHGRDEPGARGVRGGRRGREGGHHRGGGDPDRACPPPVVPDPCRRPTGSHSTASPCTGPSGA